LGKGSAAEKSADVLLGTGGVQSEAMQVKAAGIGKKKLVSEKAALAEDTLELVSFAFDDLLSRAEDAVRNEDMRLVSIPEFQRLDETPKGCQLDSEAGSIAAKAIAHLLQGLYVVVLIFRLIAAGAYAHLQCNLPTFLVPIDGTCGEAIFAGLHRMMGHWKEKVDSFVRRVVAIQSGRAPIRCMSSSNDSHGGNARSLSEEEKRRSFWHTMFRCGMHLQHRGLSSAIELLGSFPGKVCKTTNALGTHSSVTAFRGQCASWWKSKVKVQDDRVLLPVDEARTKNALTLMLGQYENLSVKGVQEWHIAAELLSGNSGANVPEYSDIGSTRRSKADVDKLVDRSMPIFCPGAGIVWNDARWTRNMKSVQIVNRACLPHNMLKQNYPIMIGSVKAPAGDDEQLLAALGDADEQVEAQLERARAVVAAEAPMGSKLAGDSKALYKADTVRKNTVLGWGCAPYAEGGTMKSDGSLVGNLLEDYDPTVYAMVGQSSDKWEHNGEVTEHRHGPSQRQFRVMEAASGNTTLPLLERLTQTMLTAHASDRWLTYKEEAGATMRSQTRIFKVYGHLGGATWIRNVSMFLRPPYRNLLDTEQNLDEELLERAKAPLDKCVLGKSESTLPQLSDPDLQGGGEEERRRRGDIAATKESMVRNAWPTIIKIEHKHGYMSRHFQSANSKVSHVWKMASTFFFGLLVAWGWRLSPDQEAKRLLAQKANAAGDAQDAGGAQGAAAGGQAPPAAEAPPAPKRRGRPKKQPRPKRAHQVSEFQAYARRMGRKISDELWEQFSVCKPEEIAKNQAEQARLNLQTPEERAEENQGRRIGNYNKARSAKWFDPFERKLEDAKTEVRRRNQQEREEQAAADKEYRILKGTRPPLAVELLQCLDTKADPDEDLWTLDTVTEHVFDWRVPLGSSSRVLNVLWSRANLPGAEATMLGQRGKRRRHRRRAPGRVAQGQDWRKRCKIALVDEAGGPWPAPSHREVVGVCEAARTCIVHKEERLHLLPLHTALTTTILTHDRRDARKGLIVCKITVNRLVDSGSGSDTEDDEVDEKWFYLAFPMYKPFRTGLLQMDDEGQVSFAAAAAASSSSVSRASSSAGVLVEQTALLRKLKASVFEPGDDAIHPWVIRRRILKFRNDWEAALDLGLKLPVPSTVFIKFGRLVEWDRPMAALDADEVYVEMEQGPPTGELLWTSREKVANRLSKWRLPQPPRPRRHRESGAVVVARVHSGPRRHRAKRKPSGSRSGIPKGDKDEGQTLEQSGEVVQSGQEDKEDSEDSDQGDHWTHLEANPEEIPVSDREDSEEERRSGDDGGRADTDTDSDGRGIAVGPGPAPPPVLYRLTDLRVERAGGRAIAICRRPDCLGRMGGELRCRFNAEHDFCQSYFHLRCVEAVADLAPFRQRYRAETAQSWIGEELWGQLSTEERELCEKTLRGT
jgi:hypothetical protein